MEPRAGACGLVFQLAAELVEVRVQYVFGKPPVMAHALHVEVFDADVGIIVGKPRGELADNYSDMQPRTGLVDELERRLEQAERAEGEKPSPEQVKALALRMAEQRERAAEDPTQDMNRPEPSGDEPLDLSEPEDLGESGPFEERSAPRTKADLLREIRQRADRRTGQQEAEQRQIDPWQAQPPQRRGHGR